MTVTELQRAYYYSSTSSSTSGMPVVALVSEWQRGILGQNLALIVLRAYAKLLVSVADLSIQCRHPTRRASFGPHERSARRGVVLTPRVPRRRHASFGLFLRRWTAERRRAAND